jgi:nucleotide-binding universal stress UspA family protein
MNGNGSQNGKAERVPAVVVGVDGSAGGTEALRWALAESRLRNAPLRAVHAWMPGYSGMPAGGYGLLGGSFGSSVPAVDPSDLQQATEELLERALADAGDDAGDVEIERLVIEGGAAEVLVGVAGPADLLVVGSRGHGGFAGLLLGSVSQQCVHHAGCPVVVVHPPKATAAGDELGAAAQAESPQMA